MFQPVTAKPDFVAQEHELLREWAERRTFARLRAQNAGGPRWSFLDGPITANNPMGVHHAWGRAYKDLFQRYHAMLGEDQRYQNGFDCQGLWVEVNVERDLGFTSQARHRGVRHRPLRDAVQAAGPRRTRRARPSSRSASACGWTGTTRPSCAGSTTCSARTRPAVTTIEGPDGPVTDTVEMLVGRLGHARGRRLVLHVQQREQRPHLGLPRRVPPARLAVQGPRHDAVVPALRHRPVPDGDERGLPGPRGPGPDRPLPARRPAGRGAARLDDDALDADLERRRGGRRGPALRPGPPGRRPLLGRQGDAQGGRSRGRSRSRRRSPGAALVGWRYTGPFDDLPRGPRRLRARRGYEHRVVAWDEVGEDEGTGIVHIAPGCGAEDYQLGKALGLPVIGPIDEDGRYFAGLRLAHRPRGARASPSGSSTTSSGAASSTTSSRTATATRTAGGAARRSCSGSSTSGSSRWARSTTSRARADAGAGRPRASATRSWRSSTASGGSRTSATTASSTGSATCTTG